ncbi:hypothetical protein ACFS07_07410 [Undibacterium arcticum]
MCVHSSLSTALQKYNLEPREKVVWPTGAKEVVLVPGQVEDDASIRYGCTDVKTNLALLQAARRAHPNAFIVYKPHPDVMSGNRAGKLVLAHAREFADHIETRLSVVSCIEACDVVHTMTSLTGFDALLRGKRVVVYGQPFYTGWGADRRCLERGGCLCAPPAAFDAGRVGGGYVAALPYLLGLGLEGLHHLRSGIASHCGNPECAGGQRRTREAAGGDCQAAVAQAGDLGARLGVAGLKCASVNSKSESFQPLRLAQDKLAYGRAGIQRRASLTVSA